jgi:hypothetical protein
MIIQTIITPTWARKSMIQTGRLFQWTILIMVKATMNSEAVHQSKYGRRYNGISEENIVQIYLTYTKKKSFTTDVRLLKYSNI